ncbi:putative Sterigmatocystin 8-O-methyltransferase [Pseudovirgaria hyperparasitica]|uniref:Putative Sterigmatocystin 8-O-methyltransferase n=1 Tax=Pseudovirgaria hyperparasitica TaxID=470096 RepID=A0A6A6W1K5_9PEZI|nr:putative Sterigmatocystin 8-O-methyltransferase [Pseudovirgaria hyperparasitica]KAF2756792.1 putative Sterigmatocystin 8-O-methyltransferase [Pseudovirgaria hyperparasitica]
MSSSITPAELVAHIEAFTRSPAGLKDNPELHSRLYDASTALSRAIEQPADMLARVICNQPAEHAYFNVAWDLKLFPLLASRPTPWKSEELAEIVKVDDVLLGRILKGLVAHGAVKERTTNQYALSPSFAKFAEVGLGDSAIFMKKTYEALPGFLSSSGYLNPSNALDTAVQHAFDVKGKSLYEIFGEQAARGVQSGAGFSILITGLAQGSTQFFRQYPVQALIDGYQAARDTAMLVDVGGNFGQRTVALKEAFKELPGKLYVQDTPDVIAKAPKRPELDIEHLAHDIFTSQPEVTRVMHDFPDEKNVELLKHLADVMTPGYSKLIVHEICIPETGSSVWASTQDMNMMSLLAVGERSERQWKTLIERAGLKIAATYPASDGISESVIEVEKVI